MFQNKEEFKRAFLEEIEKTYGRSVEEVSSIERYSTLGEMVREYASINLKKTKEENKRNKNKQVYYFSLEFLMGRLLTNNLMNLGLYEIAQEGLSELGFDINELEEIESDAGLGNGGLGRLAACFLDSSASLNYPVNGNSIRYQYGLFKQKIVNGYQVEVPDQWLRLGNVWEIRKPRQAVDVKFWGRVEMKFSESGEMYFDHVDCQHVSAVPCDIPIVGQDTTQTNTLRLWSAEASDQIPSNIDFRDYLAGVNEICLNVYPDDSNEHGKYLRLKQQYFFVAAGLKSIINNHLLDHPSLDNLADKVAIQLNDTHPVLAIPELMRILMDEYHYSWDKAWDIMNKVMCYTNHTVMQEALEKWPCEYVSKLLPRVYMVIEEINNRFKGFVRHKYNDAELFNRVSIIHDGNVRMANLAIVGSSSVNGVAQLHTDILIHDVFKDFANIYPEKFNNKTNGITHRRWLLYSNPQLTKFIEETCGVDLRKDINQIAKLEAYIDDEAVQKRFLEIKHERKEILAKFLKDQYNIELDTNTIFDVQAKRLHAYKRQLLNILHVIYLYLRMKEDPSFKMVPTTFIFGAKAAPAYHFAKKVIKLINSVASVIEKEERISKYIKVVFIPNYRVTVAQYLMNAADVSEQISTAGKEASGTGNMKFMMNGALTLGTLDGANVEIDRLVTSEHDIIFGLKAHEVEELKFSYNCVDYYSRDPRIKKVMDSLINGTFSTDVNEFKMIFDELIYRNDEYFLFADFDSYVKAQEEVRARYLDQANWARSCLYNIAKSAYFSSDRTIKEYAADIWKL